jgi:hypothetical protein
VRQRATDMRFLWRHFEELRSHRFTSPRHGGNSQHYQICLIYGTAYEYDWKRVRRTDRLLVTKGQHPLALVRTRSPGAVN